jgi:hypothetical protein
MGGPIFDDQTETAPKSFPDSILVYRSNQWFVEYGQILLRSLLSTHLGLEKAQHFSDHKSVRDELLAPTEFRG